MTRSPKPGCIPVITRFPDPQAPVDGIRPFTADWLAIWRLPVNVWPASPAQRVLVFCKRPNREARQEIRAQRIAGAVSDAGPIDPQLVGVGLELIKGQFNHPPVILEHDRRRHDPLLQAAQQFN